MNIPKPLREPDFTKLETVAFNYLSNLQDEDADTFEEYFKNRVFEKALEALYGRDVFGYVYKYLRKNRI